MYPSRVRSKSRVVVNSIPSFFYLSLPFLYTLFWWSLTPSRYLLLRLFDG